MVVRNLSTTEAKNRFSAVINAVATDDETVVVEQHGRPKAAIISMVKLDEYERALRLERRREALAKIQALQSGVSARNQDLTEEQAMALADRFVREVIDEMIAEGKLRYEGAE